MNVIYGLLNHEEPISAAKQALETIKPNKLFAICNDDLKHHFTGFDSFVENYDYVKTRNFGYVGKIEENDLLPLDRNLLEAFSPYMDNTLWQFYRIGIDNEFLSYDMLVQKTYEALIYWNTVIERHKIDLFIAQYVPHYAFEYIIYILCKIKGIKTIMSEKSMVIQYSYMFEDITKHNEKVYADYIMLKKQYENTATENIPLHEDFEKIFLKYTDKKADITPHYMRRDNVTMGKNRKSIFVRISRLFKRANVYINEGIKNGLWTYIVNWFKFYFVNITKYGHKNGIESVRHKQAHAYTQKWESLCTTPDLSKNFVYFGLHMQPEVTTCPMGAIYKQQELVAQMLAKSVPEDVIIYIKENPHQLAVNRTMDFPEILLKNKNVRLVSKTFNTYDLIENCIATASVTGTLLWEGVFKNKPGIMFGDSMMMYVPGVHKVTSKAECEKIFADILNEDANTDISQKDLKLFLLAFSKHAFRAYVPHLHDDIVEQACVDGMREATIKAVDEIYYNR